MGICAGDSEKAHHGAKIALKNDFYEGATPILKIGSYIEYVRKNDLKNAHTSPQEQPDAILWGCVQATPKKPTTALRRRTRRVRPGDNGLSFRDFKFDSTLQYRASQALSASCRD